MTTIGEADSPIKSIDMTGTVSSFDDDELIEKQDDEKFNVQLPTDEIDAYKALKKECLQNGWKPGTTPDKANPDDPAKLLTKALVKRAISGVPLVLYLQKESIVMEKLQSLSKCSEEQWDSFTAAERMVSDEVEEVRAEADLIELGWSKDVWRQAVQYYNKSQGREESKMELLQLCKDALKEWNEKNGEGEKDEEKRDASWDPVREWIGKHTEDELKEALGEAHDESGPTAWHIACKKGAPMDILNMFRPLIEASEVIQISNQMENSEELAKDLFQLFKELRDDFKDVSKRNFKNGSKRNRSWEPVRNWMETHSKDELDMALKEWDNGSPYFFLALERKAPDDIIMKLLQSNCTEALKIFNKRNGLLPLHLACRQQYNAKVIMAIFEAYPQAAKFKPQAKRMTLSIISASNLRTPFEVLPEGTTTIINHVLASEDYDEDRIDKESLDWECDKDGYRERELARIKKIKRYERLALCRDHMPSNLFQEAVYDNLENQAMVDWLNDLSCCRKAVFSIMLEFYFHVAMIICFIRATENHIQADIEQDNSEHSKICAIILFPCAFGFLVLEIMQLLQRKKAKSIFWYLLDFWNCLDLATIVLVFFSAERFLTEEPLSENDELSSTMRNLLVATGFFILIFFVSFLKKTFFAFAKFVGGMTQIFLDLIPFLVISGVTLFGFTYMYHVLRYGDVICPDGEPPCEDGERPFGTLKDSFFIVFGIFAGGPDEPEGILDIISGLVIVIILLNVVIAIVSESWEKATDTTNATQSFWKFRLCFVLDANARLVPVKKGEDFWTKDTIAGWLDKQEFCLAEIEGKSWEELWPLAVRKASRSKNSDEGTARRGDGVVFCFVFLLLPVLGLFTFGLCWPTYVREYLFTTDLQTSDKSTEELVEDLRTTTETLVEDLRTSFDKQMGDRVEKNDRQIEDLKNQIEELKQLLVKNLQEKSNE